MLPIVPKNMLDGLLSRAVGYQEHGFTGMWQNGQSFERHLARRMAKGEVIDAADYERKTLAVFRGATTPVVATPANRQMRHTGKMAMRSGDWIVLLSEEGGLVTSYPRIHGIKGFEERHLEIGDRIDEYTIGADIRSRLEELFG
jgi:hypothetical protein